MDSNFPCKACGCKAWQHYQSIAAGGDICIGCYGDSLLSSFTHKEISDPAHSFAYDALWIVEQKYQEKNK